MSVQKRTERLLVVDDDPRICQMLARYFEEEGFRVTSAGTAADGRKALAQGEFDALLLDLNLPGGETGLDLAREIRSRSDIPIVMLTGRDDVIDRIVGLEVGADDYIAKPFHLREVLARVRAVLRRRQAPDPPSVPAAPIFHFDGWVLDIGRRSLTDPEGKLIALTTAEFDMLAIFVRHPGHVLDRDRLMDLTRGRTLEAFDRTIDAQIARLRKKIEHQPGAPEIIKSVRGVGYVFTARVENRSASER